MYTDPPSVFATVAQGTRPALQAEKPCFWFGVESDCLRWHVMAAVTATLAAIDLASSLALGMLGDGAGPEQLSVKRCGLSIRSPNSDVAAPCTDVFPGAFAPV